MKILLLAFASGLVGACGFQPLTLWPLTLAGFAALLWLVVKAPHLRSALARGWWFGFGQFLLGLNWIATSFTYQAAMPVWLGWIAVALLSAYLAVYPAAAAGLAWRYGRRHPLALVLWFAAAWIVTEWLRATLFTGFAWNPGGVALLPTPAAWLAPWIGTYGLSGIMVLLGGALYLLVAGRWRAALALSGVIAVLSAGALALRAPTPSNAAIAVRIVQPNIGQDQRWQGDSGMRNIERIAALSRGDGKRPRLLLWPESAVTMPIEDQRSGTASATFALRQRLGRAIGPNDLLLAGGVTIQSDDGADATAATNSIFALTPGGRLLARYDKAHLVPYGEYLPMRPLLSAIGVSRLAPGDLDFVPGSGPRTIVLPMVGKVGFQLCYEIIFSGQVVDQSDRPAFLFNPSNDAWFGAWGPPQHLAQARLRALEEGLPVLRATPTGISAVIDADGRLAASLPLHQAGVIDHPLPAARAPTLFARLGNLLPLLLALLLAAGAIAVGRKAR